jgi:hypothetical protein
MLTNARRKENKLYIREKTRKEIILSLSSSSAGVLFATVVATEMELIIVLSLSIARLIIVLFKKANKVFFF